ncbi:MipA/OmpV family protein [Castellaniella caeni]|uniref:MipA/OmpV family protein n=1 Tax=Castellaniella caeni TaxID=266123 RepID=UPI000C9F9195|nr:MipA/OmpV family protein [Castellaniella caeni]
MHPLRILRLPRAPRVLRGGFAAALLGLVSLSGAAQADDRVTLGVGVSAMPRYEGADEYKGRTIPIVNAQIGRFYARTEDGIGFNFVQTQNFTLSAGANMMWGYGGDDVPPGIGGLSDAIGARLGLSTNLGGFVFGVAATQAVTHRDRGLLINTRVSYPYALSDRVRVTPSVGANWANEKYMDSYFGINGTQSRRSGLAQYHPDSGVKDVSARVSLSYAASERFSLTSLVGTSRLVGEAADSPMVRQKTQFQTLLGGSYTF